MKNESHTGIFNLRKKDFIVLFIFAILIALFYGNTLRNGFVHDDVAQVQNNTYVHSLRYLPDIIVSCPWQHEFKTCSGQPYFRPTQNLSYLLSWIISPHPWIFHLVNLIYFLIGAFLVFVLLKKLTQNTILSFFAGILFVIHPINSEVVNWIAAVPDLLYTIFAILTILFYLDYREQEKKEISLS